MAIDDKKDESFLSRWSRRKVEVARGAEAGADVERAAPPQESGAKAEYEKPSKGAPFEAKMPQDARPERTSLAAAAAEPLPTIESMTAESDFAPFMRADVAPEMRNQAMKKLFTDPHYNVMDRLDIYIDDYGQPDPIPPAMLRMMNQSRTLGLFEEEERAEAAARLAASGSAPEKIVGDCTALDDAGVDNSLTNDMASASLADIPQADAKAAAPAQRLVPDNSTFPFTPVQSGP